MKKFLLSFFVITAFIAYSFHQQEEGKEIPAVTPKPSVRTSQNTAAPTSTAAGNSPTSGQTQASNPYKDGTYTGDVTDAFYGNVQVQATIQNGKITDVQFLQYPNDRGTSVEISNQAMPALKQEAIQNQTAQVDVMSGATQTSNAFVQSLQSALNKAKS